MDKNIRIQLIEMSRLMSYDRSKTLFEQTNNPEIDDKGNNINPNASYYGTTDGTTDKVTPYEQEMADRFHDGDVEAYRFWKRRQEDSVLQGLEKDRMSSYQDRFSGNRYNPKADIMNSMSKDEQLKSQKLLNDYAANLIYREGDKPTEPVVVKGEDYDVFNLDKNGKTQNPNGYWRVTYDSPRYKKYFNDTIQPMLDGNRFFGWGVNLLSGEYKEDVWRIYRQDLEDWDRISKEVCPPDEYQESSLSFLKDWNAHDWLETGELITGLIGMIPVPPVALVGNLLSMGFGVANAELYRSEGNYYDASIAYGLAFVPGPEVARLGKNMAKSGKTVVKNGAKQLTDEGAKLIDDAIRANWRSGLSESLKLAFKGNIGGFLKYMLYLYQKLPRMAKFYVSLAGFPLTMEQLYYLWTLSLTPEQQLSEREKVAKSRLKPVVDMFKRPDIFIRDCTKAFVKWIKDEEVKLIDNIDPSMFENIKPEKTEEETLTELEALYKQYEEKPD